MHGRTVRLLVGVLGTMGAVGAEWVALDNGASPNGVPLDLAIGLVYLYGGLAIWDREPANRTGALMTAVGLTWFIPAAAGSGIPVIGDLAVALYDVSSVFLLALVLAYPAGRLETRADRAGIAILAVGTTTLSVVVNMTTVPLLLNEGYNGLYGGLALAVMAAVLVFRRWLLAPARSRRDLLPVLLAGAVFVVTIAINLVRRIESMPDETAALLIAAKDLAPAAIPVALLIGFYRQSERRLRALVDAIPDPVLRVGRDGSVLDVGAGGVATTPSGAPAAPLLLADARLVASRDRMRAAAAEALASGELQSFDFTAEVPGSRREYEVRLTPSGPDEVTAIIRDFTLQRAAEAEVRQSRARIVEATDAERRRLERDLHDGAQQRLVALSLAFRVLRARLAGRGVDDEITTAVDEAASELKAAMTELRELARGIHPAILTEAGLGEAITTLANRSVVPARVARLPDRRLPPAVEATAYFLVAEALTNVGKYASASRVTIEASCDDRMLQVRVEDDGAGGADPARGTGIRGLEDRVAALGGQLALHSPKGHGTRILADIPIA